MMVMSFHTGEIGDGKIFAYNVENAIKIRTDEEGVRALYYRTLIYPKFPFFLYHTIGYAKLNLYNL